jgi:iron complex transport system substrate-binding protein
MLNPRPIALALAALAAVAGLTACGTPEEAAGTASAGGAFPVTVEHKYGSTEIKKEPKRVVTLGLSDQDAVLALGVKPVGAIDWFKERPYGKWPWAQPLWGDKAPEIVGERDEFNVEKIAALTPDLIIAQYTGMKKEQYETLSKIAPVVGQPKGHDDWAAPWKLMTQQTGKALGKADEAEKLIAAIDERFAKVRKEHPEFATKTVVVADSYEPGKYSAFSPTDPKTAFMKELGFKHSEAIAKLAGTKSFTDFGSERLDLLDVDKLIWLVEPASEQRIKADPVYQRLKVTTDKRAQFLPYDSPPLGGAMSFNTVLSIPYAIDQVVPLLAR